MPHERSTAHRADVVELGVLDAELSEEARPLFRLGRWRGAGLDARLALGDQRIDRQLAARRTKLMKELRERITELERRIGRFNSERAALWAQVEVTLNVRMLARLGR